MAASSPSSVSNPRHPALAAFLDQHAILRGDFTLASGRKSDYYCDGKQASFSGEGLALVVDAIEAEISELAIDAIGGMDMGATPIVAALALALYQRGRPLPAFVVRKDVKAHGTRKPIEGILPATRPGRVVILDDVVTSGESILKAIDAVREAGHEVILAISILDRDGGGAAALAKAGVPYRSLVTIAELGIVAERTSASRA